MDSGDRPILSICIGTYNRKQFLSELLQQILESKESEIEVIVCDNASTDGTWDMLNQIEDKRLCCYQNEQNFGAEYNWFKSMLLGNGKYLMNLNDRELIDMMEVQRFISVMRNVEASAVVASGHFQCEQMNTGSFEDHVCLISKLGEPGDVIYSGDICREYKEKYGSKVLAENVREEKIRLYSLYFSSDKWYWYERRLIKDRSVGVLKKIKVERRSDGYIFTGSIEGQIGVCTSQLKNIPYLEELYRTNYCRGIIKAYARTFFLDSVAFRPITGNMSKI